MLSEELTPQELNELWIGNTHKINLRKEIASHPNADQDVIIEASRLYVREVLKNPALDFIELFCSEEDSSWVRILKFAYSNPMLFLEGIFKLKNITPRNRYFYRFQYLNGNFWNPDCWKGYNLEKIQLEYLIDSFYRGPLIQAVLYGAADANTFNKDFLSLFFVIHPSITEYRRALKDPVVKNKLQEYLKGINTKKDSFYYENIYYMWIFGMISDDEMLKIAEDLKNGNSISTSDLFIRGSLSEPTIRSATIKKFRKITDNKDLLCAGVSIAYRSYQRALIEYVNYFVYNYRTPLSMHKDAVVYMLNLHNTNKININYHMRELVKDLVRKSLSNIDYYNQEWKANVDFDSYWEELIDVIPKECKIDKIRSPWMGEFVIRHSKSQKVVSALIPDPVGLNEKGNASL